MFFHLKKKKRKKWSLHLSQKGSWAVDLIIKFQDTDNCWIKKKKEKKKKTMNNWYKFKFSFKIKIYSMRKTRFFSFFRNIFKLSYQSMHVFTCTKVIHVCIYVYTYIQNLNQIGCRTVSHTGANQSFSAWISSETKKCISRARTIAVILYSIISGTLLPRVFLTDTSTRLSLCDTSLPFYSKILLQSHIQQNFTNQGNCSC